MAKVLKVGVFITSHGFGHATRTCAILNELSQNSHCKLVLFSTLPSWFFSQNIENPNFELIDLQTDIGLVQKNPFIHDLNQTLIELKEFLLFKNNHFEKAFFISRKKDFDLIICDISPLGLEVASRLGVPSVLVENFTWDWIYQDYLNSHFEFGEIIEKISGVFARANLHIQATPFCELKDSSVKVSPVSRLVKRKTNEIKESLGCDLASKLILLTTGGITKELINSQKLKEHKNYHFIISGNFKKICKMHNLISLPMNSSFHYPDLVNASNLVVGKVGYGTLAECWATNTPLLGCYRNNFRESKILRKFANKNLIHREISIEVFESMDWIPSLYEIPLEKKYRNESPQDNGAKQAAQSIIKFLG